MAKKTTSGHIIIDRDHADVLKHNGLRSQSVVEFDLVYDDEAGKFGGDYTEIIIRLGSEELDVKIEGRTRMFWLELVDTIHDISDRAERPGRKVA